jgi:hypothetical protein
MRAIWFAERHSGDDPVAGHELVYIELGGELKTSPCGDTAMIVHDQGNRRRLATNPRHAVNGIRNTIQLGPRAP